MVSILISCCHLDRFVRSAKEVLCQFIFRSDKLTIGPDSEPPDQIGFTLEIRLVFSSLQVN